MSTPSEFQETHLARELAALRRAVGKLLRRLDQPLDDRDLTIPQWCAKRNVSRAGFYKMKKAGRAPRVIANGGLRRITREADREWEARWGSAHAALQPQRIVYQELVRRRRRTIPSGSGSAPDRESFVHKDDQSYATQRGGRRIQSGRVVRGRRGRPGGC